jgi:hypothetical protein
MTPMPLATATSALPLRALRILLALGTLAVALLASGCGTGHPRPIATGELAEVQTFPYFRVYWVGPSFEGHTLAATDGLRGYIDKIGLSVYYGDCVQSKGIFGGGSCLLPLQVTTVVYRLHTNASLGPQRNTIVRGVPAVVYDGGHTIELYTGRLAIDVFSDTFAHALNATSELLPVNAPGTSSGPLPAPVYCPGLSGPLDPTLKQLMANLPAHVCQRAAAASAYERELYG